MTSHQSVVNALKREDFFVFLRLVFAELNDGKQPEDDFYLELLCNQLQRAAQTDAARLLVTMPPRYLKSITSAVALPAWLLGKDPTIKIMVACYSEDLAREHAGDFRKVVNTGWYRKLFPNTRWDNKGRNDEIRTTKGGIRRAVTVGGPVTGFGANFIVLDDLMKAASAKSDVERERVRRFYQETILSRFDEKKRGKVIAIQQRLHEDDFAAFLMETGSFDHLNLPAIATRDEEFALNSGRTFRRRVGEPIAPNREPLEVLEELGKQMGPFAFSAQYQQDPTPREGALIEIRKLNFVAEPIAPREAEFIIQSWDTAHTINPTSNYSVCTTWGITAGKLHVLDLHRARYEYPALKGQILKLKNEWKAEIVLIEGSHNGSALVQQFMNEGHRGFVELRPVGSKEERIIAQTDLLQSDKVEIPANAPWTDALRRELMAFPNGRYDDQIDSISQFLGYIRSPRGRARVDHKTTPRGVYALRDAKVRGDRIHSLLKGI